MLDALKHIGVPAIVNLNAFTFAAVLDYSHDGFYVIYPPHSPSWVKNEAFAKAFGKKKGRALLLSKTAIPVAASSAALSSDDSETSGPHLMLSRAAIALGRLWQREWQTEVVLTNNGTEPLQIQSVQSSCSCLKATVRAALLDPSQMTVLTVAGQRQSSGYFGYEVTLRTNAPGAESLVIPVHGYVEYPVLVEPPVVDFGRLPAMSAARAVVAYELPVECKHNHLSLARPGGAPFRARSTSLRGNRGLIEIEWIGTAPVGRHDYTLLLGSPDLPNAFRTKLRIGAEVIPALDVFPPSIVLRPEEFGTRWARNVTIVATVPFKGPLSSHWSDASLARAFELDIRPTDKSNVFSLLIGPKNDAVKYEHLDGPAKLIVESQNGLRCDVDVCPDEHFFTPR